jgi:hypothetical protein
MPPVFISHSYLLLSRNKFDDMAEPGVTIRNGSISPARIPSPAQRHMDEQDGKGRSIPSIKFPDDKQ